MRSLMGLISWFAGRSPHTSRSESRPPALEARLALAEHALLSLESVEWFRAVGEGEAPNVARAGTWTEAFELARTAKWEEIQLETNGALCGVARALAPEIDWNRLVEALRPRLRKLVEAKSAAVVRRQGAPQHFIDSVSWDVMGFALEAAFARELTLHKAALEGTDLRPVLLMHVGVDDASPSFYTALGGWYQRGNWPCGWRGAWDSGRLVIY